jgi:pimeloyl-ACP methyl ester carboxylesterase
MTAGLEEAVSGTAAGVPFVALPPVGRKGGPAPMVAIWHPLGPAGSPEEMATVLPLRDVGAWRVYFGLPRTGSRAADVVAGSDLVLDIYTPMIEQAAAEFAAARAELRDMLPVDDGPVAVVGSSAGGHTALRVLTSGVVPVTAAALINPAVRTESVVAVNEDHDFRYTWTEQARQQAAKLDIVAAATDVRASVLLVIGEDEYPEFRPDQDALLAALGAQASQVTIAGMDHTLVGDAPARVDRVITDWLGQHFGREA